MAQKSSNTPEYIENLVNTMSGFSVSIDSSNSQDERRKSLAQFDVSLASLIAADPQNPMINFFLEKQKVWKEEEKEWKEEEKEKKNNKNTVIWLVSILIVVSLMTYGAHKLGWFEDNLVDDYLRSKFEKKD